MKIYDEAESQMFEKLAFLYGSGRGKQAYAELAKM
jgi:hypothetical protein